MTAPNVTDAQLVETARRGDGSAFGELYERYRDAIYRYCLARTGSSSDAEDLVSDVFLRAMRSLHRWRDEGVPFLAFLYRVARNAAIDRARRATPGSLFTLVVEPRSDQDLEANAARASDVDTVMQALRKIRPEYREVILLRSVEGYSVEEVARMLGKDKRAISNLQHRGLERLRRELGAKGD
jgi:RNA polymerase sigma-70 factor (ECF subfamily)